MLRCTLLARSAVVLPALVFAGWSASAQPRDEDLFIRPEDQRTVLFGSIDGGRSVFVSGGSKQALSGSLDRTGFVAMETAGSGLTRERLGEDRTVPVFRLATQTSAMI